MYGFMNIKFKIVCRLLGCLLALCASSGLGFAQLGIRVPALDEYCRMKAVTQRETIVYVDLSNIGADADQLVNDLAITLTQKIGLAPRERLRILVAKPNEGAKEVFNKCWPELTQQELRTRIDAHKSWWESIKQAFDQSPEQQLKDTKDFFRLNIQNSIKNEFTAKHPLTKLDILRVLSADKNRFGVPGKVFRILIFSRMGSEIVHSFLNSNATSDEEQRVENLFKEYPVALDRADTYVWGVAEDTQLPLSKLERFWTAYLQRGGSNLKTFGPEFPIQESRIVLKPIKLRGNWTSKLGTGRVMMDLPRDERGKLVSAWVTLQGSTNLYSLPLDGRFECKPNDHCILDAQVAKNVPYLSKDPYFFKGDVLETCGQLG